MADDDDDDALLDPSSGYGGLANDGEVSQAQSNGSESMPHLSINQGYASAAGHRKSTHCHPPTAINDRVDHKARRKLIIASVLCLSFMIAEVVGGVLANSLAIATDAAHLLTDFASFMISLFALYIASRPATKKMSFGWYRAEVVGALVSVLMIWVVTGVLVYMAVQRVISEDYEIDATIMLITSACGVGVNIIMGVSLHDTHGHSHGGFGGSHTHSGEYDKLSSSQDSHDEESEVGIAGGSHSHNVNINVRAAFIHVMGDLIQSIGVCIAAIIIFYKPEWKVADPICTFVFSILVLFTTLNIMRDTMNVLMEGTPRSISFNDVRRILSGIEGVVELHNLRIWSLTLSKTALAVHLALEKSADAQDVLKTASQLMRDNFGISECTIQVEAYVEEMQECDQCQDPKD